MTKSLDELNTLTNKMNDTMSSSSSGIQTVHPVIQTVDANLTQATELIKNAQNTLTTSANDVLSLSKQLKVSTDEITQLKNVAVDLAAEVKQLKTDAEQ